MRDLRTLIHRSPDATATAGGTAGGTAVADPPAAVPAAAADTKPAGDPAPAPTAPAGDPKPAAAATDPPNAAPATPADPATPAVPEKYDLKLPENAALDAAGLERIAATARARGLSHEAAQQLADDLNAEILADRAARNDAWRASVASWESAALADQEVGGTKEQLAANVAAAKRALDRFSSPTTKQFLNDTGFGSHPEVIRIFARIGKQMAEGSLVLPSAPNAGRKSPQEVLYGGSSKE